MNRNTGKKEYIVVNKESKIRWGKRKKYIHEMSTREKRRYHDKLDKHKNIKIKDTDEIQHMYFGKNIIDDIVDLMGIILIILLVINYTT